MALLKSNNELRYRSKFWNHLIQLISFMIGFYSIPLISSFIAKKIKMATLATVASYYLAFLLAIYILPMMLGFVMIKILDDIKKS